MHIENSYDSAFFHGKISRGIFARFHCVRNASDTNLRLFIFIFPRDSWWILKLMPWWKPGNAIKLRNRYVGTVENLQCRQGDKDLNMKFMLRKLLLLGRKILRIKLRLWMSTLKICLTEMLTKCYCTFHISSMNMERNYNFHIYSHRLTFHRRKHSEQNRIKQSFLLSYKKSQRWFKAISFNPVKLILINCLSWTFCESF